VMTGLMLSDLGLGGGPLRVPSGVDARARRDHLAH
jgi:hypothetical protein